MKEFSKTGKESLKKIDYDWRSRVRYEELFAEQCAIAVRDYLIKNGLFKDKQKSKEEAERIGEFFSDALNALYVGFKQYPEQVNGFLRCGLLRNTLSEDFQQREDKGHQV